MNILDEIYRYKLIEVRNAKKQQSLYEICNLLKKQDRKKRNFTTSLENKIKNKNTAIIAEVKKASPSKGIIRKDFDPIKIAQIYEKSGASCISVLTDEKYFMGKNEYLTQISDKVNLPILRKDFIVDSYQIYQSKLIGADCILLIMAMIDLETALEFERTANNIGLEVLIEVHNQEELEKALKLRSKLIGINNRNLKTLKVDINNSINLAKLVPSDKLIICESGIYNKEDINLMKNSEIYAFLIGESLMISDDISKSFNDLIDNKSFDQ